LESLFPRIAALVSKIERWWILNVDIATDPDMMHKDIADEDIAPGSAFILHLLSRVALGEDEEAWEYYLGFMTQKGG
jgi:hypothetical protein